MLHFFVKKLTPQDYSIIIHIYSWILPVCCYSLCLFSSKLLTLLQFLSIFPLCVIPLSDYNVLRLIIMHKRLVVNIFSSLLLGAALISAPVYAAEKTVVNISKVDGMPWFNRMGEG